MSSEPIARAGWFRKGMCSIPKTARAELTTPLSESMRRQISALPTIGVTTGMKKMTRRTRLSHSGTRWSQ